MKKMMILIMFAFGLTNAVFSQFSLTTVEYSQNFTIGTSATATIPTGFKFGPDWSTGTTVTTESGGSTGTGAMANSSAGGAYNFANGVTATSTERAIGFLSSGSYSSPRSITFAFTNNTGVTITSLTLSWNYEKYRSGSRAFNWTFFHGNTSNPSTSATSGDQSYAADANNNVTPNPPLSISKKFNLTGLSITNGSTYYLRWTYTGSGGSTNGQALGIDDFSLFANCTNPIINGSGKTGLTSKCDDGTFNYYGDASGTYFAIDKTGTSGLTGETVTISVDATAFSNNSSNGANQEHASFFMKRGWDVTAPAFTGTAKVRFYYESTDSADAVAARNTDSIAKKTANPSSHLRNTPFTWFKSKNTAYTTWRSANVRGNHFTAGTYDILTPLGYGTQNGVRYVEFSGITSFSGGSGGAGFGPGAGGGSSGIGLPVTWAGFDVETTEAGNELTWKTASEQNTDYFQVEYSYDSKQWSVISERIAAAGNSADLSTYNFTHSDFEPFVYYRIKQVDLDGKFDYSVIKLAKRSAGPSFVVKVYPIPLESDNMVNLSVKGIDKSSMNISMKDMTGKVIRNINFIPSSEIVKESFNMSPLAPGIYFIEVQNGQGREVFKVSR